VGRDRWWGWLSRAYGEFEARSLVHAFDAVERYEILLHSAASIIDAPVITAIVVAPDDQCRDRKPAQLRFEGLGVRVEILPNLLVEGPMGNRLLGQIALDWPGNVGLLDEREVEQPIEALDGANDERVVAAGDELGELAQLR